MKWEILSVDHEGNPANEGRVFVTDGKDSFHVDQTSAQRLADLLSDGAKTVTVAKTEKAKAK